MADMIAYGIALMVVAIVGAAVALPVVSQAVTQATAPSVPGTPPAGWWNASYYYRMNITAHNNDNVPYAPLSVNTLITYQPQMETDFSDLNFVDAGTGALVPSVINSKVDGSWANVTFVLPAIGAHGYAYAWMYYGD